MNGEFSLGYQTLLGTSPPELIRIAAEVGCSGVSISAALSSMRMTQPSLLDDKAMRQETAQALRDTGLSFDLVEGVSVAPDTDLVRARATLEVMRDLGAPRFNLSFWEPDADRSRAVMDAFWQIGLDLQMRTTIEFVRRAQQARSLAEAAALATWAATPDCRSWSTPCTSPAPAKLPRTWRPSTPA